MKAVLSTLFLFALTLPSVCLAEPELTYQQRLNATSKCVDLAGEKGTELLKKTYGEFPSYRAEFEPHYIKDGVKLWDVLITGLNANQEPFTRKVRVTLTTQIPCKVIQVQ